jgi:thiol-disulfide isomerase/thioredoxin
MLSLLLSIAFTASAADTPPAAPAAPAAKPAATIAKPAGAPAAAPAAAVPVTLHVGDPAPVLQVDKWLKGEPTKTFEPGKIYVIECWATWCGPCIASMPHVTKMAAKYKDKGVIVIGVDVWERDLTKPEPFVKEMGDKMGYNVVMDDLSGGAPGAMASTWLKAAGRNGIPCSFLIDRTGKIAWIGHPMQMERPLSLLADDKFDIAAEAKLTEQMDKLSAEFAAAMKAGENDKALATLDSLVTLNPTMSLQYSSTRLMLLLKKKDYVAANTLAASIAASPEGDAVAAPLAATLLNGGDADGKILAVKLADRAYQANKDAPGSNGGWQYQLLLAKAYAATGQYSAAVQQQEAAIAKLPAQLSPQVKEREEKTLSEYQAKTGAGTAPVK